MKKAITVIAVCFIALFAIFYFTKSGPFKKAEPAAARAQEHQQRGTLAAGPKMDPPAPAAETDVSKPLQHEICAQDQHCGLSGDHRPCRA